MQPNSNPVTSRNHASSEEEPAEERDFGAAVHEAFGNRADYFLDIVRIYLGIGLFVKGIQFLVNSDFAGVALMKDGQMDLLMGMMSHYIPLAHIAGGLMLAAGLMTRFAALSQVPILLGAVFLVHLPQGLFTRGQTLEFALLVLFLLALFMLSGGGPLSLDRYFERKRADRPDALHQHQN
ncbi:MAG TPA: DoxX family protein [Polyangiaceae bacterium]|nr:DoxX family protein [Polyangiaceae bacterium]